MTDTKITTRDVRGAVVLAMEGFWHPDPGADFDRWLAEHDREVAAEWADYIERWGSTVGAPPFTQEAVVEAMRRPRPFGSASADSVPEIPGFEGTTDRLNALTIRPEATS